jgi:hypothetical protein
MWRRVIWYRFTDVSEERTASSAQYKQLLYVCVLPMSCYGLLFDPEDEVRVYSSETSMNLDRTTNSNHPIR